jgi:hypothetical protein
VWRRRLFELIVRYLFTSLSSHTINAPLSPKTMNSDAHSPPSSTKDAKPTLDELESMLHKTKLIDCSDQPPSSRTMLTLHDNSVHLHDDDAHSAAALAQVIAAAVTSAMHTIKRTTSASVPMPRLPHEPTTTILDIDMALHTSPCSSAKMDLGRIQVARMACGDIVEAHRKISD